MIYQKKFVHSPKDAIPQCHAATITEFPDHSLLCAWYAGEYEKAKNVEIYASKLGAEAHNWEPEFTLANTPGFSEGNPILFTEPTGRIWHLYVTMLGEGWLNCQVKVMFSEDGISWSQPELFIEETGWMTGCKPIMGSKGDILIPLYLEKGVCYVLKIGAKGERTMSQPVKTQFGVIQPSLAYLSDGRLMMMMRTYEKEVKNRTLWQSFSSDVGLTWSGPERARLPNPDSRIDILRLHNGNLALAFNDTPSARSPLTLALSDDDGKTWSSRLDIETNPNEYSYPALIQSSDGLLHLVYTWKRTHICHVVCDEEWIRMHGRGEDS